MSSPPDSSMPPPATLPPIVRPRRRLPLGVAILSFLLGLYGFFVALLGVLIIVGVTLSSAFDFFQPSNAFGLTGFVLGIIVLIIGLIILGIAVALWRLRLWALVLALIFLFVEMVGYALDNHYVSFGFIFALIIFVYLLAVNRHFR